MNKLLSPLFLVIITTVISSNNIHGQAPTDSSMFKISAVNIDFGGNFTFTPLTNSDYLMFRNSALDQTQFISNPEDYTLEVLSGGGGSFAPSISIGLSPLSKKKGKYNHNQELRLKIGSGFGLRRSFVYTNEVRTPYDTLTSSIGNDDILLDSVYIRNPNYSEIIYEFNIGAAYLFKTNTQKRWHFYTGFSAEYAIAFQSFATILNTEGYYFGSEESSSNTFIRTENSIETQSYRSQLNTNSHFLRFYVPVGVNFRIANKNEFWRHFNLYAQGSGGMELHFVSNGGNTYANAFGAFAFLGVRYTIN